MLQEKTPPVLMENAVDVRIAVAASRKYLRQLLQIRNRLEAIRALFGPKAAVEITADANVPNIPRKLANVIDVIHHCRQRHVPPIRLPDHKPRLQHPRVERDANHA